MRPPPDLSPPKVPDVHQPAKNLITQERKYKLITPLYGGGVEPSQADPITLIRGTSIRGQLRFWWRACRAGQFSDVKEMKTFEDKLWGTISDNKKEDTQSKVKVAVKVNYSGEAVRPFRVEQKKDKYGKYVPDVKVNENRAPAYAVFPLRPEQEKQEIGMVTTPIIKGVSFTLKISFPEKLQISFPEKLQKEDIYIDVKKEVEAALWAWETFGGVGARTRRGFGAIRPLSITQNNKSLEVPLPEINNVETFIEKGLREHLKSSSWPEDVPHLSNNLENFKVVLIPSPYIFTVWEHLINRLKDFRQERNNPSDKYHPGRSRWPEPDTIRNLTEQHTQYHEPKFDKEDKLNSFPRAAFGLPIIFEFRDRDEKKPSNPKSDPKTTRLTLSNSDRLASPLILRPLMCKRGKAVEAVGLAIILEGTQRLLDQREILLSSNDKNRKKIKENLKHTVKLGQKEAAQILKSDNRTKLLGTETDVLKAFLDFLK
ncbi:MAG: CRISPR-associated RAMP Cmr1 family protein [bacterium]|nr:MAG: CRISPR-associated RAMP Cmr1 family protein [bacterium]